MCVGMNLAYAELYVLTAMLFRRFDFELFETGRDSVDVYSCALGPLTKPGTEGVRVLVK